MTRISPLFRDWNSLMDQFLKQEEVCKLAKLPQGGFFEHCKFEKCL